MNGLTLALFRRLKAEREIDDAVAGVMGEAHCPVHGDGVWQGWLRCGRCPSRWHVAPIDWDLPTNQARRRRFPGWGLLAAPYEAVNA